MSYQSQGPEVVPYRQGEVLTSLNQHYPLYPTTYTSSLQHQDNILPAPALNKYGESQIEAVFAPVHQNILQTSAVEPVTSQRLANPSVISNNKTQANRDSNFNNQQENKQSSRFDSYLNSGTKRYKYNLFSVIDEPWNRCSNGQSCESSVGNQCIADQRYSLQGEQLYTRKYL